VLERAAIEKYRVSCWPVAPFVDTSVPKMESIAQPPPRSRR
jgi:hypothetical protein